MKEYRTVLEFDLRELAALMPGVLISGRAEADPDRGYFNPTGKKLNVVYSFFETPVGDVIEHLKEVKFDKIVLTGLPQKT